MKEERLTPFDKSREHHERIDDQREKPELHWEFVVLYGLSAVILVLIIIFVLIMCSACSGFNTMHPATKIPTSLFESILYTH